VLLAAEVQTPVAPAARLDADLSSIVEHDRTLVVWPVTLPGSWVASTKPEAVIARRQGRGLDKGEGGLWRRVIAGQGPGERCRLHH
jgi:hypothetical protein